MNESDCIFFQLAKVNQKGSQYWGKQIADLGITAIQGMILSFLYEADGITAVELGTKAVLDSSTMTGIIDRLESSGLIERRANPKDRRSILIYLTPSGTTVAEVVRKRMEAANTAFLSVLDSHEIEALKQLISKIRGIPESSGDK
ncbi:MAG: MarR family transcriptional regulator, organic hydroperoxide resistance regulator [Clostridiales bacterium]|jgi:DNA-binding MarR family transcriptional regulator|nr:MarR family transcriptional regulator, organic hydroperoxide resistance regulator [Clostridiales bacterium]MDN5298092.1 MarR family transcriptional regulator, organic hydroperoxide resistance regulator [Clostridiales bacterium]